MSEWKTVLIILSVTSSLLLMASWGSAESAGGEAAQLFGTYLLISESGGYSPADGAKIELRFIEPNVLAIAATKPGVESVTDMGTFSVHGGRITLELPGLGRSAKNESYSLTGSTLTLPIFVIDDGQGTSAWERVIVSRRVMSGNFSSFHDSIARGESREGAFRKLAARLAESPAVASAKASGDSSILITYTSGYQEVFLAPAAAPPRQSGSLGPLHSPQIAILCPWPGAPPSSHDDAASIFQTAQLHLTPGDVDALRRGRFAKWIEHEPEPVSRGDAPGVKKALVVSAFHTLPLLVPGGEGMKYESFQSMGENLAEVTGPLSRAGYEVPAPVIDGEVTAGRLFELLNQTWGAVYLSSHGGVIDDGDFVFSTGEQIEYPAGLDDAGREEFWDGYLGGLAMSGLGGIPAHLHKYLIPILINHDSLAFVGLRSGFFKEMKGDRSASLIYVNGCESAKNDRMRKAMEARVFMGWQTSVQMELGGLANRYFWPVLSLKTRSAREAMDFTLNHLLEVENFLTNRVPTYGAAYDPRLLKLYRRGKSVPEQTFTGSMRRMLMATRMFAVRKPQPADMRSMVGKLRAWNSESEFPGALKMAPYRLQALGRSRIEASEIDQVEGELCGYADGTARFTLIERN